MVDPFHQLSVDGEFLNQLEIFLDPGPKPLQDDCERLINTTWTDYHASHIRFACAMIPALDVRYNLDTDLFVKPTDMNSKPFAHGPSALVHRAKLEDRCVVVKVLKQPISLVVRPEHTETLQRDLKVWKEIFKHPNLLELLGVSLVFDRSSLFVRFALVSPFIGEDLLSCELTNYTFQELRQFFLDTAQGLHHLHQHIPPIIHGDIKASHIFIGHGRAVLAGFTSEKLFHLEQPYYLPLATLEPTDANWLAPELVENPDTIRTVKTDIFAFGCAVIEAFTKKHLVITSTLVRPSPLQAPHWDGLWNLLLDCLVDTPENRPDTAALISRLSTLTCQSTTRADHLLAEFSLES